MKAIAIPQPWGSATVFGLVELVNAPQGTDYRGPALVVARGVDNRFGGRRKREGLWAKLSNPLIDTRDAVLGVVRLTGCGKAEDCQLAYAAGPVVLATPVPWHGPVRGTAEIYDKDVLYAFQLVLRIADGLGSITLNLINYCLDNYTQLSYITRSLS